MSSPAMQFTLHAKQREIDALRLLADRIELTDLLGRLIHALQRERGISSIYLASDGKRFVTERGAVRDASSPILLALRDRLDLELGPTQHATARMLSMIAWVLLDLDSLDALRARIDRRTVSAPDSVMAFSKVIGGLMELIFQLADVSPDPGISRTLVALVHVVQGKEAAGQERAVGGHMFAAGTFSADQQQRFAHLIGAQQRSLDVFLQFAGATHCEWWQTRTATPHVSRVETLRQIITAAKAGDTLDAALTESWFDATSARITDLWHLQIALTMHVRQACDTQIGVARQALRDSEHLFRQWRENPPPHTHALEHFFAGASGDEFAAYALPDRFSSADRSTVASLQSVLQAQAARLARVEVELDAARRALHDRKLIERAKAALMARHGLREEAAFRMLQKGAMDQNKRLVDVAEAALASPDTSPHMPGGDGRDALRAKGRS
ncbi:response regulator receiver protein [Robbsia andropogonis]|uniref:Response regulator receiver protein n=1 Tax=Robbsia andropogonis TaxID=28092 RepID=A0A0F5K4G9_9BURK|nr:nitrate regulatory protein [Robbsia andropogonis]KKB64835.1 response regulator receiver protein [Robbsia andropogonis]MCP1119074.1 nitrate- and nitrite sensing domain-containing protein [Robbsia andropogonis]MCP1129075.1 nitrate- and nitrite sensing domain-containing protein [Robbsia andropogonis]